MFNEYIKSLRHARTSNKEHIKKCYFTVGTIYFLKLSFNLPKRQT